MQLHTETLPASLQEESVLVAVEVMAILETKRMRMHAADYRGAARHVAECVQELEFDDLLALARSGRAVLADAAIDALFELEADDLVLDGPAHATAKRQATELLHRL